MLVLSRKKGESIVINNDITLTVVEIRGDKVRLAVVAPKSVPVHRQEVFDAIHGRQGFLGAELPALCTLEKTCTETRDVHPEFVVDMNLPEGARLLVSSEPRA